MIIAVVSMNDDVNSANCNGMSDNIIRILKMIKMNGKSETHNSQKTEITILDIALVSVDTNIIILVSGAGSALPSTIGFCCIIFVINYFYLFIIYYFYYYYLSHSRHIVSDAHIKLGR